MPETLRKQLGYHPENSRCWFGLTSFLEEKGAWALAEAACRKGIEIDPEGAALLMFRLGRPSGAESAYREAPSWSHLADR